MNWGFYIPFFFISFTLCDNNPIIPLLSPVKLGYFEDSSSL